MTTLNRLTTRIANQTGSTTQQATTATYLGTSGGYASARTEDRGIVQVPLRNVATNGAIRSGQQVQLIRPLHGQPFINAQVR